MRQQNNSGQSRAGFALIVVTLASIIVLSIISSSTYLLHKQIQMAKLERNSIEVLICAESGLAKGKWLISNVQNYHTDLNFTGTTANIKAWLIDTATGQVEDINNGHYKIVKEISRNRLFSIGYLGATSKTAIARKVLQFDYSLDSGKPGNGKWQEL